MAEPRVHVVGIVLVEGSQDGGWTATGAPTGRWWRTLEHKPAGQAGRQAGKTVESTEAEEATGLPVLFSVHDIFGKRWANVILDYVLQ